MVVGGSRLRANRGEGGIGRWLADVVVVCGWCRWGVRGGGVEGGGYGISGSVRYEEWHDACLLTLLYELGEDVEWSVISVRVRGISRSSPDRLSRSSRATSPPPHAFLTRS